MDERAQRWQRRFEPPVLLAALLVIPVIVIEQSDTTGGWRTAAGVVNWIIWLVFAAEVVVMLTLTRNRRQWLRRHPLDIAIVILTPPVLPAGLQALRAVRLLRLLRLLRAVQAARRLFTLEGLKYAALLAAATALGGGAAFAAAEGAKISAWDGVWWAVSTMTTVGYGDISPHTNLGRAIAMVVMIVGIGFFSLLIGAAAERFVSPDVQEQLAEAEESVVEEIESTEAEVRAELREIVRRLGELERRLDRPPSPSR